MKIIGFHCNQFSERGTEISIYDYAYYNEEILNNKSIILYPKSSISNNNIDIKNKFQKKFLVIEYDDLDETDLYLD